VASLFERLRPPTEDRGIERPQNIRHAQKLLDWLQHWGEPTISAREICIYGPRPIRKREKAGNAAEILVRNGWLVPLQTRRCDMEAWQIVRRPVIYPDCSRVADPAARRPGA
jgi:hypothetical protein